jgi:hypothetical protein
LLAASAVREFPRVAAVMPEKPASHGTGRACYKGDGGLPVQADQQGHKHNRDKDGQIGVLLFQKGHSSFVDHLLEVLHGFIAIGLFLDIHVNQIRNYQP